MGKLRILLIALLTIFFVAGIGLLIFNFFVPKAAGLLIETTPASTIYINGEEVGRTPYTSLKREGEVSVRIVPDSFGTPLAPFETKINLVSGVETVIRRYFGRSDEYSEGEILTFEALVGRKDTGITIITEPENAQIIINDISKGASPFTAQNIGNGLININLRVNGYKEREIEANIAEGYKLLAFIKLAKSESVKEEIVLDQKPVLLKMVKILKTPTGFLRVRSEASSSAKEIARVEEDDEYQLLAEDVDKKWYKISPKEGLTGWVTNQYAEIFEKDSEASSSAKIE